MFKIIVVNANHDCSLWAMSPFATMISMMFWPDRLWNHQVQNIDNLYKWVELFVANWEIAHHEQFHLLPQWFQKSSVAEAHKGYILVWERVKTVNGET